MRYRYRATIYVDVWSESKLGAEEQVEDIVLDIPNAFQTEMIELPHGSKISLDSKEPKCS